MKTLLFDFENPSSKDRAVREVVKLFTKSGAQVVTSEVAKVTQRRAGVVFRNVSFTFADGQMVIMGVKATGDVFEVRINGKATPLKYQDDHAKAVAEIAQRMDLARSAFQKQLARIRTTLPASIKISRPNMLVALESQRDSLKVAVTEAKATLAELTAA
ncbi:MAG: hypothetical protein H7293_20065 [Candidatus Saccharibacteria bacterium]|nr:hypothetical protein [Rhodoferax sp.]